MDQQVEFHRRLYGEWIGKYGDSPRAVGYNPARYWSAKVFAVGGMDLNGRTVLDVGCGHGDLVPLVMSRGAKGYLGVDLMPEFIDVATTRYGHMANVEFHEADFFKWPYPEDGFDVVFAIGVATYADAEWFDRLLAKCHALASELVVIQVTTPTAPGSQKVPGTDQPVFTMAPEDLIRVAKTYSLRFALRHDYADTNQLLFLYKDRS